MEYHLRIEKGLRGVIADTSTICYCDPQKQSLLYRGYSIQDLVQHASYEEVVWLLLHRELPKIHELSLFKERLNDYAKLTPSIRMTLEAVPPTPNLMDVLRSCCSLLGHLEPEDLESDPYVAPERLLGSLFSMLLYWYHFHAENRKIDLNFENFSFAEHLLKLILGIKPDSDLIDCLNTSLILYAEHEFSTSTFVVRCIASTQSDIYSAICGGIGALRGPLHGGANEEAFHLIQQFSSTSEVKNSIQKMLSQNKKIMGFGHRRFTQDPRTPLIKQWALKLGIKKEDQHMLAIAETIEKTMLEEKNLYPNVDFYTALAYHFIGIPSHLFTPLFALARIAGWSAHLMEQRRQNVLIRPESLYTGHLGLQWKDLNKR